MSRDVPRAGAARVAAVLALVCLVTVAYLLWARPYQLRWGATAEEVRRAMPGDSLNPRPTFLATRAITIENTPPAIWPWLVQMGYGRAGFYGYDILENLGSERGLRSADRIVPELQHVGVGDEVPISAAAVLTFWAIEPDRYLVWAGKARGSYGTFTWALYPVDEHRTRLVSRIRWTHHWAQPGLLALDLFSEFTDHLAVPKILEGVRDRVAGRREPVAWQNVEFAVHLLALLIFVAALVLLLARRLAWRGWLAGLASGAAWLLNWYAPLPTWIGALLVLAAGYGLVRGLAWSTAAAQPVGGTTP